VTPDITMLYVDPPAWGSGVASRLLRSGLKWIDQQGHREARLRVVEVHHRARRFYEREGLGRRPSPPARSERLLQAHLLLQDARWPRTVGTVAAVLSALRGVCWRTLAESHVRGTQVRG
jgi:ribosomal protein S18 acetylase RimI-like enzyme